MPHQVDSSAADGESGRDRVFDAYVDREHKPFVVYGQQIPASDALWSDPVKYQEARSAWLLEQADSLCDLVIDDFPYPIAHCFRRYRRGCRNAKDRLAALQDTWEATIHVLFALTLAELRSDDHVLEDSGVDRRWVESQTIAARIELIEKVAEWGEGVLKIASVLHADVLPTLRELNQERNGLKHRADLTEHQAEVVLTRIEPIFLRTVERVRWLADWEFVRPTGAMHGGKHELEIFRGYSAEVEYLHRALKTAQRSALLTHDNHQCEVFALHGDRALCLAPIIHWMPPQDTHHTHVGVLKKRDCARLVYEVVGRAQDVPVADPLLLESLQQLKSMFVKTGQEA